MLRGNLAISGIESVVTLDNKATLQAKLDAYLAPKERQADSKEG